MRLTIGIGFDYATAAKSYSLNFELNIRSISGQLLATVLHKSC